jgi:hypothetical protein
VSPATHHLTPGTITVMIEDGYFMSMLSTRRAESLLATWRYVLAAFTGDIGAPIFLGGSRYVSHLCSIGPSRAHGFDRIRSGLVAQNTVLLCLRAYLRA